MTSIVFCNFPVANIETNLHFINICHDYFVLFDTEIFRQQTTSIVICRMVQTKFLNSLLPGNPVFIAVTLYLDYLLFRYFQHVFHLGDSFRFGAKVRKRFRLCYTCWAGCFPFTATSLEFIHFFYEAPYRTLHTIQSCKDR